MLMKFYMRIFAVAAGFVLMAVLSANDAPGYKVDFQKTVTDKNGISGWVYKGKPGASPARFSIATINGVKVLKAESDNASGSILFDISKFDLKKYPIMRWKWRADILPTNADGRDDSVDDQAIGVYAGAGRWSTTSAAYRWETNTPKKTEGSARYGMGLVSVKWHCVRNKEDKTGVWYVDECNIYEALKQMFNGNVPTKNLALSISANSQYTKSKSLAYLEYVEFLPLSEAGKHQ